MYSASSQFDDKEQAPHDSEVREATGRTTNFVIDVSGSMFCTCQDRSSKRSEAKHYPTKLCQWS